MAIRSFLPRHATDALQMIALYGVDLLVANPQHLQFMVAEHRKTPIPTPTLKLIKVGGNAMPPQPCAGRQGKTVQRYSGRLQLHRIGAGRVQSC